MSLGCRVLPAINPTGQPHGAGTHGFPNANNYQQFPEAWGGYKIWPDNICWDKGYTIVDFGCDALKGATLIATGRDDWNIAAKEFMELELGSGIAAFYFAYDARANPRPSWLSNAADYELLSKKTLLAR